MGRKKSFGPALHAILQNVGPKVLEGAARDLAVEELGRQLAIVIDDKELQLMLDQFRLNHDLLTPAQTAAWLDQHLLTEHFLISTLKVEAIYKKLIDRFKGKRIPTSTLEKYSKILACRLIVEDEGIAKELYLTSSDRQFSFEVYAKRYTIEPVNERNPIPGIRRYFFPIQLPAAVQKEIEDTVGFPHVLNPIFFEGGWHLYKIYERKRAQADAETVEAIAKDRLARKLAPLLRKLTARVRAELSVLSRFWR